MRFKRQQAKNLTLSVCWLRQHGCAYLDLCGEDHPFAQALSTATKRGIQQIKRLLILISAESKQRGSPPLHLGSPMAGLLLVLLLSSLLGALNVGESDSNSFEVSCVVMYVL